MIKKYLKDLKELEEEFENSSSLEEFITPYLKAEFLIGSSESVNFIEIKAAEFKKDKK